MISMGGLPDVFDQASLYSTVTQFYRALQDIGVTAAAPTKGSRIIVSGPDDTRIKTALKNIPGDQRQARLILIILLTVYTLLYNRVKHAGDIKVGVHIIVLSVSNLLRHNRSTLRMSRLSSISSSAVLIS